jgi:hypothetical protein
MRKFLIILLGLASFCFLIFLAAVFVLLFTPTPLKWVLAKLDNPKEGLHTQFSEVEGSLLRGFAIRDLALETPQARMNFPKISFQYDVSEFRNQGGIVISDVSCIGCKVVVLDPLYFIEKEVKKSPDEKSEATGPTKVRKHRATAFILQNFLVSDFMFSSDLSKVPPEKMAKIAGLLTQDFKVKEIRVEHLNVQSGENGGLSFVGLQKLLIDSPWIAAQINELSLNIKSDEIQWKDDAIVKIQPAFSKIIKKTLEFRARIMPAPDQKEIQVSAFEDHVHLHFPLSLAHGNLAVDALNVSDFFTLGAPLEQISFAQNLEGPPSRWKSTLLKEAHFVLGGTQYKSVEFNEERKSLVFSDASQSNKIEASAALMAWPPQQLLILKSAKPNAESLFRESFPEKIAEAEANAGQTPDYPALLRNVGLIIPSNSVFTRAIAQTKSIRRGNRAPAGLHK